MGRKKEELIGWAAVIGALVAAIGAGTVADLSAKWEHALVYTVLVFVVSIMALRPAWSSPHFWRGLGVIFLVHVIAISIVTVALPPDSLGIRGIPLIAMSMGEFLLIANILWAALRKNSVRR